MSRCSLLLIFVVIATGCASQGGPNGSGAQQNASPLARFIKSDIDEVIEIHQQRLMSDLQLMMYKLYLRNPSQRHDRDIRETRESVDRIFAKRFDHVFAGLDMADPTDLIRLSLEPEYQGDRVLAFIIGLRRMLMAAYDNRTEFYYLTQADQQKLYNSARNIEIAAWLLAERRDADGELLLLSDSLQDEQRNLSYQRLFGQMIATQDNLAEIISHKTGRLIKTVVVKTATVMFLPI